MEAFASFFRSLNKKSQPQYYALIPEVLNILIPIKESQDSEDLSKALVALIDLAESAPKMFKPLFSNLVQFNISVIQDKELSDICRQNALELMATFADYAPSMCKKDSSFTNDMITQCLSLMTDLGEDEDVQDWLDADDVRPTRERELREIRKRKESEDVANIA
jgi:importin-5